jgi:hypothetical protein
MWGSGGGALCRRQIVPQIEFEPFAGRASGGVALIANDAAQPVEMAAWSVVIAAPKKSIGIADAVQSSGAEGLPAVGILKDELRAEVFVSAGRGNEDTSRDLGIGQANFDQFLIGRMIPMGNAVP